MDHTQILLRPVVTEKATFLRDGANQVAFFVHPDANKIEIKKAVETAFNVKVTDVNVVTRKPTERVRNRKVSRVPGWRKAYVTLASVKRSSSLRECKHGCAQAETHLGGPSLPDGFRL